ncbi:C4-dicarboxylate TRAP transporter substrate-binding protein [Antarcticimicrobium sediminis]|nr:C4-dicarboxylate TRAP transporter substrate-binding protein [Antarcticimicrobium sediminis]
MNFAKNVARGLAAALVVMPISGLAKELKYNTYQPGTHQVTKNTASFGEALSEATGGDLSIDVLSGGAVASGKATLSFISDGLIDAGLVTDVYVPGDLPHTVIASSLALEGESSWVMAAAMAEYAMLKCPGCQEDLDEMGVINLGFQSTSTYKLLCNNEISGIEDLQGKKIKAAGPWSRLVVSWGAAPVNIPFNDVYEGMQRGQIDCALAPDSAMEDYGLYDVVKTVVDLPMGTYHGFHSFVLNRDVWDGLPEEQSALILDKMPGYITKNVQAYHDSSEVSKAKAIENGTVYTQAGADLKASIAAAKEEGRKISLENAHKQGIDTPEENLETFLAILSKWTGLLGTDAPDPARYEELLRENVYSKVSF